MKVLKYMDLFGQKITFRVFNENKFHTYISVILTFILVIGTSIFTYFQGLDFIFHNESKTLQSRRVNIEYEFTKLSLSNFFFAWQIQDDEGNNIDFSNVLYPHFFYSSYKNNAKTLLKYDKCSNFQEINLIENLPKDAKNFYCSDIGNLTIGGGWENNNIIDYFFLLVKVCSNGKCTTKNDLLTFLNLSGGAYFVLYYPTISFLPDEKIPYQISYNKLNILLNDGLSRYDRFYIEKKIIVDDQGWLLPSYQEKILYDVSEIETNYYIRKYDLSYTNNSNNDPLYFVVFYLTQKNTYYKRWFAKAFESLTVIATFFKIIYVIFKFISRICNEFIFYGLIIDESININRKNKIIVFNSNKQKSNVSFNKSKFNDLNINKALQINNIEGENKKENNLSDVRDISVSSLVDKQKYKNRLSLNQNDNIIKFCKNQNIYNNKNDKLNDINYIRSINSDNNIKIIDKCKLNINVDNNSKKFKSVSLSINRTHDIESRINQMLKNINNIYKLFFACIFCQSKKIKTVYNYYRVNRKVLENKMDVVNYLRLIEKGNSLKITS